MPATILPPPKQPQMIHSSVLQQVPSVADVAQKVSPSEKQIPLSVISMIQDWQCPLFVRQVDLFVPFSMEDLTSTLLSGLIYASWYNAQTEEKGKLINFEN